MTLPKPGPRLLLDNLVAGYAYLGFTALVTLLLVPIYVATLGPTQWGIVAWCLTLQGVLFSLDAALAPLLLRDAARAAAAGQLQAAERRFLRLYGSIALLACLAGQAILFLVPASLPDDAVLALRLALLQFLFQFANGAAIGVWHALQRQRFANARLVAFALVKHGLALALVLLWQATPLAYFLPFVVVGAVEFALNRWRMRRERIGAAASAAVDAASTANVALRDGEGWSGLTGFAIVAALGIAMSHIDRILLAPRLDADTFGLYFLLGTVLLSVLHLQMPLQRSFLPRIATDDVPRRAARGMLLASIALIVLPCLLAAAFVEPLLRLWLHDARLAAAGAPTLRWMLLAAALLALSGPSWPVLLVQRRYRTLATIQAAALIAQVTVLWLLTPRIGLPAGGLAWLAAASVQLACAVAVSRATVQADSSASR